MRPSPHACRAAAHSILPRKSNPQALWITDDALADALHRYTQASHAAKRCGCKRFGSNVPGPLEARRRRAGRRMGGLSCVVGPPSALPDFGALFGGPFADRTPIEKSWKWEPPSPVGQSWTPPDESSETPPIINVPDLVFHEHDPVEHFRQRLRSIRKPENAYELMKEFDIEPDDRAVFSQIVCDHFIRRISSDGSVGYAKVFDFVLDNPYDVIEAGNVKRVARHLARIGFSSSHHLDDFVSNFLPSACQHTKLSTSDMAEVLDLLPSVCYNSFKQNEAEANAWLFKAYWNIWRVLRVKKGLQWASINKAALRKVAERIASLPDALPTSSCQQKVLKSNHNPETKFWLFRLQVYTSAWPVTLPPSKPQSLEYVLASWAHQLVGLGPPLESTDLDGLTWAIFTSLFDSLPRIKALWAIAATTRQLLYAGVDQQCSEFLPSWVSCLSRARVCQTPDLPSYRLKIFEIVPALATRMDPVVAAQHLGNADPVNLARGWLRAWLPLYAEKRGVPGQWDARHARLKEAFEQGVRQMDRRRGYDDIKMFELIFRLFTDFRLVCHDAVNQALNLLLAKHGSGEIVRLLHRLQTRNIFFQNPTFLAPIIESLAADRPLRAYEVFKNSPGMWLSLCPNLPLRLAADGALKREEFFSLMYRWPKVDKYNLSAGEYASKKSELALLRCEMVHFVAFAWADATILPTRVRFRNVWYCWRFLNDFGLPSLPLLSKAFVRAGITAPLQQRQWVSRKKIAWIFEKFVRPLEGEYVEKELGRLVHAWRGDLIEESRRRWDAAGLFDRYGPSTVEMVRRAGLFNHDFPLRGVVRKKYARPGPNAADRFPRLWHDKTYSLLPKRDLLRWSRTPVRGSSRSRITGRDMPRMLLNGRWRTWYRDAMRRWKVRKEKRRVIVALKRVIRGQLKSGDETDPERVAQLQGLKQWFDELRRVKIRRCRAMSKMSVWDRARVARDTKKPKVKLVPHDKVPGNSIIRKVDAKGSFRIPRNLRWK